MSRHYVTTTGEEMALPPRFAVPAPSPPASVAALEAEIAATEAALDALQAERAALRARRRKLQHDLRVARDSAAYAAFLKKQEMHL